MMSKWSDMIDKLPGEEVTFTKEMPPAPLEIVRHPRRLSSAAFAELTRALRRAFFRDDRGRPCRVYLAHWEAIIEPIDVDVANVDLGGLRLDVRPRRIRVEMEFLPLPENGQITVEDPGPRGTVCVRRIRPKRYGGQGRIRDLLAKLR
jgi:hypothetical protein